MVKKDNIKGSLILTLASLIWGLAFVAQDGVSDKMPPIMVNAVRFIIAFFLLSLFYRIISKGKEKVFEKDKTARKTALTGGAICGALLALATNVQQIGITVYPDNVAVSARGGFLTALYVIIVPVLSVFLRKKIKAVVWLAVLVAMTGVYLICFSGGIGGVYLGDILLIACSFCFSFQIMFVDKYCDIVGGVRLSCIQFLFCGIISGIFSVVFESSKFNSVDIKAAAPYLFYLAFFSSAIGYTLQVVGQKYAEPYIASLAMSLESVFATLGGWVIMHNSMSFNEIIGSALVFAAIILAQTPEIMEAVKQKQNKKTDE